MHCTRDFSAIAPRLALVCTVIALMGVAACGSETDDPTDPQPNPGSGVAVIHGRVFNGSSAAIVVGATVRVGTSLVTTTDASGAFTLPNVPADQYIVLTVEKQGYASALKPHNIPSDEEPTIEVFLVPTSAAATLDAATGGSVLDSQTGAKAVLGSGALVDSAGVAVTGTVEITISTVDATDPLQLRAFPGAFVGEKNGTEVSIETFNPMDVSITKNGEQLELAAGQTVEIFFPITRDDAPDTIDLWSLNEETGTWEHEGTAVKIIDGQGNEVYKATISHLSWWNPDHPIERSCASVCVTDAQNAPQSGAVVKAIGVGYGYGALKVTGSDGCTTILVRRNYQTKIDVSIGPLFVAAAQVITATAEQGSCAATHQLNFVLEAATNPNDCPTETIECGGVCTDTHNSIVHCGSCDNTCSAGRACVNDTCACPGNRTVCGDACVDTLTDNDRCGACNIACAIGQTCVDGACEAMVCPGGTIRCGSGCVDPLSNAIHCGGCGVGVGPVSGTEGCTPTNCTTDCFFTDGSTPAVCNGACVNLLYDRNNCGSCGNACGPTEDCDNATCQPLTCGANEVVCNGRCLNGDACGTSCDSGDLCEAGTCEAIDCGTLSLCGSNCVDTQLNRNNCGSCGKICTNDEECIGGACTCTNSRSHCPSGNTDICVDTQTDRNYCGDCSTRCLIGEECLTGTCTTISCSQVGTELCGNSCIDPLTDGNNCGGCTYTMGEDVTGYEGCVLSIGNCGCAGGPYAGGGNSPDLSGGSTFACPDPNSTNAGWLDCIDLLAEERFCGACDISCAVTEECVTVTDAPVGQTRGVCVTKTCPAGSMLCSDGSGRCVYGTSCGDECNTSMGETCDAGSCACPSSTPDSCTGVGCVDLQTDPSNCGTCDFTCQFGEECSGGGCVLPPCSQGEYRCNNVCVNVMTSAVHCGGCSVGGVSMGGISCYPDQSDCSCSVGPNVADSPDLSSQSSYACPANPSATTSADMHFDCVDLLTDEQYCGGCDASCTAGQECIDGTCQAIDCGNQTLCGSVCVESPSCGISCNEFISCVSGSCQ